MSVETREDGKRLRDPEADEAHIRTAMGLIEAELRRATAKFGVFASSHEGLAIIEEEFLELREAIFWPHKGADRDPGVEAVQLGAMAARFLVDMILPRAKGD